jgi:cytochrome c556
MSTRMLVWLSLALWAVLVVVGAGVYLRGRAATSVDTRHAVAVNAEEREAVLKEMRGMLTSLQGILAGLATHDMRQVSVAAKASGMAAAADPALEAKLPAAWIGLAEAVHGKFDEVAATAAAHATTEQILGKLDTQLQSCAACHLAYRLP